MKEPSLEELTELADYAISSPDKGKHSLGWRVRTWVEGLAKITPKEVQLIAQEGSGHCNDRMRTVSIKHLASALLDYFYSGHRVPGLNVFCNANEIIFTRCLDLTKARRHLDEAIGFQSVKAIVEYMVKHDLDVLYLQPNAPKTTGLSIYG